MRGWKRFYIVAGLAACLICRPAFLLAVEPVEVLVEGLEGDVLKNVEESLALPYGLIQDGRVDRLWLDRFGQQVPEAVKTALEPFGYYNAAIDLTIKEIGDERYRLAVRVVPGEPVRVAELSLTLHGPGAVEKRLKQQAAAFPLQEGSVLRQPLYEEAKEALLALAQDLGYLDADFSVHEILIVPTTTSARIRLLLETGERYFFKEARIEGAPDYPDKFLRRYLAFKPGEIFSYARLGETQLNFANSERFREVKITPDRAVSKTTQIPVLVQLQPAHRRSLRQGFGYGTDTGARFSIRYRDLNMRRQGEELSSSLFLSEHLQGFATGYTWPDLADINASTLLQFNLQQEDGSTYLNRVLALEFDRNRSFGNGRSGTAYLRLQREEYTIGAQDSDARLVLPGLRFSGGRYDNPIRPSRGLRYDLDLRGTHQRLGSSTSLLQLISKGSYLLPLPQRFSVHLRTMMGITFLSDPLSALPPSLRFFAGGDQSVRGYTYQSLGPRDAADQIVGGKHLLTGSVEIERALFKDWGASMFYDVGNAFDSFAEVRLFEGVGVGAHYYTPVGALNFFLARQVGVADPNFHLHFTVGFEL